MLHCRTLYHTCNVPVELLYVGAGTVMQPSIQGGDSGDEETMHCLVQSTLKSLEVVLPRGAHVILPAVDRMHSRNRLNHIARCLKRAWC
jgi:hypothetical protein